LTDAVTPDQERYDNPLERLQLLSGDDEAIASFLDEIEVRSPRERELLTELARPTSLRRPDRFVADHTNVVVALESLRRHGFHGTQAGRRLGPARLVVRWLVELVARYIVVSHVKSVAVSMRNLYWLREIESPSDSRELELLRPARMDAQALTEIFRSRELGVPSFVIGGLAIPVVLTIWRLASDFAFATWQQAVFASLLGAAIGVGISWIILRGSALASRRIRLALPEPLGALWVTVGWCGVPPRDRSRHIAAVAITLTVAVWIVLPLAVGIALAS
jgi:hypothetical protein